MSADDEQPQAISGVIRPTSEAFSSRAEFVAFLDDDKKTDDEGLEYSSTFKGAFLIGGFVAFGLFLLGQALGLPNLFSAVGMVAFVFVIAGYCLMWSTIYADAIRGNVVRYEEFGGDLLKYDVGVGLLVTGVVAFPVILLQSYVGHALYLLALVVGVSLSVARNNDLHNPEDDKR